MDLAVFHDKTTIEVDIILSFLKELLFPKGDGVKTITPSHFLLNLIKNLGRMESIKLSLNDLVLLK